MDGWQPSFGVGYQEYLFVGPVFTWLVGLVQAASLGTASVLGAFKAVVVLSFVLLPFAVAFLARSFGFDRTAATVAALLTLAVSSPFGGVGLQGIFQGGLLVHQLAAIIFCLGLGSALRAFTRSDRRWVLATAGCAAALLATHNISVILFVVFGTLTVGSLLLHTAFFGGATGPDLRGLARLGVAATMGCLLGAFSLVPTIAHWDLRGIATIYPYQPLWDRLTAIWNGDLLFQPGMAPLFLLGWLWGVSQVRRDRPLQFAVVVVPPALLAVGEFGKAFGENNLIGAQLPSRGLGYAALVFVLPLAALVARLARFLADRRAASLATVAGAAMVLVPMGDYRDLAGTARPTAATVEAAGVLRRVVPEHARFAVQQFETPDLDANLTGVTHVDYWLAWASGRNTLNIFLSSPAIATPDEIAHMLLRPPEEAADILVRHGVTHLALTYSPQAALLMASSRFSVVWQSPPLAILAIRPRPTLPGPESLLAPDAPMRARVVDDDPEHLRFEVQAERRATSTVAVSWSPKWNATVDGRRTPLRRSADGLLSIDLPEGHSTLRLDFRSDAWDRVGVLVTLTSAAVLAWWVRRRNLPLAREDHGAGAATGPPPARRALPHRPRRGARP